MKRIKPLNIVLGIAGLLIGWFGVQALMPSNTSNASAGDVRDASFVKLIRDNYPEATRNFADEVLIVQADDVCSRIFDEVPWSTIASDFTTTMAVTDPTFSDYFVRTSFEQRCKAIE